jgi:hypothetical protein
MDDRKRRRKLTDADRLVIRKRFQTNPEQHQKELVEWFTNETGHPLNQSQVSKILGDMYTYLDGDHTKKQLQALKNKSRTSRGEWPDLEAALYKWQQHMQEVHAIITGDTLKEKAAQLWEALPQYAGQDMPKWSNGWLGRFKGRFNIKEYEQHGEAASAAVEDPDHIAQMERLRLICTEHEERNILNMDETGLNWRRTPDRTLATQSTSVTKKSKDRITIALTTNADGSEKLEPWIIGQSENPRSFKKIQRQNLRITYKYNNSKWMTGTIFEEYLLWLNNKMRGERRLVLLLLDNFSAHQLGLRLVGEGSLSNVQVEWLPKNTTSVWQPLDQGIIASFKLQYRKHWIRYMIREHDAGRNPQKTMTLLKAVLWTRSAWETLVQKETIQQCWAKSTLIRNEAEHEDVEAEDRTELQAQIAQLPIQDPLSLTEFLCPNDEDVVDDDEDVFASVVEHYSVDEMVQGDLSSEEEEVEDVQTADALHCVEKLRLWKLQKGNHHDLNALDRVEKEILTYKSVSAIQTTLDNYFTRT